MPRIPVRPRHPALKDVSLYQQIIGNLIAHSRASNSLEERSLRATLTNAEALIYKSLLSKLLSTDPGKESGKILKEQHCDSVRTIRESHRAFLRLIKTKKFYSDNIA